MSDAEEDTNLNDETPRATKGGPLGAENNKKSNEEYNLEATKSMSKSVTVPGVDEEALKRLWVAEQIVDRPCSICCCIFIFVIILGVLDSLTFELSDEDDRTWFVEDSVEVENFDQWTLAEDELKNAGGDDVFITPQTTEETAWVIFFMFELLEFDEPIDVDDPSKTDYWILTPENLELIIEYERMITNDSDWMDYYCYVENTETFDCVYTSLARDVAEHFDYDYSSMTTEGIKEFILNLYYTTDSPGTVESSFNERFAETNQTYLYRSFLNAGAPIATEVSYVNGTIVKTSKYRNINHKEDDQEEDYVDFVDPFWQDLTVDEDGKLKDGNLRIIFVEGTVFNLEFNVLLLQSMVWVILAIVSVIIWMTVHLQSCFLSLTAVGEILLSFPFAYCIYRYILQIDHFDTLSMLIIFVLLGVGADDVFVFTDAWRQSLHFVHNKKDLKQRMSFAYRRAAKAMLVTQATTFFAFLATSASRITPIAGFGLWSAAIVACNYILVITMYPALLLIHHNWVRKCERKYCCCCCPDNEHHNDDDEGESAKTKSNSETSKQRAKDKKEATNDQETIELTTSKQAQHISPRKEEIEDVEDEGEMPPPLGSRQPSVEEQSADYDCLERFFAVKWAGWIDKFKIPILLLFALLFALAIWRGANIEEQDEEEEWFPDGHFMKEALDLMDKFTSSEESGLVYVILLWGTNGVKRGDSDRWDPDDYGTLKWDNDFDISSIEAQEWFYDKCRNLTQNELVFQPTSVTCVFDAFEEYLNSMGESFPWSYTDLDLNETTSNNGSLSYFDAAEQRLQFAEKLYNFTQSSYANHINQDSLVFVERSDDEDEEAFRVRYIATGVYAAITFDANIDDSLDFQDDFDSWLGDNFRRNDDCPEGICDPIQASFRWCWLKTNREFIRSAIQGIAIALPLAFIVLLISTQNWIMAIFATVDIIGVMSCELMVMELMGWKFGVSESVAIVIVIGFSVDYVVHLANAFLESNGGIRSERTQFALLTMGISVTSGAVTTFLAGIFLSFPAIIFFYKMGILIMTTIAFSLAWSMLFFIALLSCAGPEHDTGNIPCAKIAKKICNRD